MGMNTFERPVRAPFAWAERLTTVGVTGTNGKTSTTHMIGAVFGQEGPALTVGTVGYFFGGAPLDVPRTAQGFLASQWHLHQAGGRRSAVECTSQALAQGYARTWRFDVGVFTNLSEDHIESHGSWEHYLAAKAQLFVHLGPGRTAVLNAADPASDLLEAAIPADVIRRWYAAPWRGTCARPVDLAAAAIEIDPGGTRIRLQPGALADALAGELEITMVGAVFAENALAAALGAFAAGVGPESIRTGLRACPPVPGRFEIVARDPCVVVDFAHTPDALARTLETARRLARRHVLLVLGAGGQRSAQKREPMGEVAGARADRVWLTNDNPRNEDPHRIAAMLEAGLRRAGHASWTMALDRGMALKAALQAAGPGDVVVVAGKGHEQTQDLGTEVVPWSDAEVLRDLLGTRADQDAL